jgi:hypothetical protein
MPLSQSVQGCFDTTIGSLGLSACGWSHCTRNLDLWFKKVPLCQEHFDAVRAHIQRQGWDLYAFEGNVRELLVQLAGVAPHNSALLGDGL